MIRIAAKHWFAACSVLVLAVLLLPSCATVSQSSTSTFQEAPGNDSAPADDGQEDIHGPVQQTSHTRTRQAVAPTPQRPTFATDTNTTAAGTWELEFGVANSGKHDTSTPVAVKYGVDEKREMFVTLTPYVVRNPRRSPVQRGRGNLLVGYRERLDESPDIGGKVAWLAAVELPTGSKNIRGDDDEASYFGAVSLDGLLNSYNWTAFYQFGLLGDDDTLDFGTQHILALALGHPLEGDASAFGELAVLAESGGNDTLYGTVGITLAASTSTVWDIALREGLVGDDNELQVTLGLTHNFGRRTPDSDG